MTMYSQISPFFFLSEEAMLRGKKNFKILVSEYSEQSKTSRNMILAGVQMYVLLYRSRNFGIEFGQNR